MAFEPNISIGDLLVLARLRALQFEHGEANPADAFCKETGVSIDRVRDALKRISKAAGEIELTRNPGAEEGHLASAKRSLQPSLYGGNIGAAGVLANWVVTTSQHPDVDQSRFRVVLAANLKRLQDSLAAGEFARRVDPPQF